MLVPFVALVFGVVVGAASIADAVRVVCFAVVDVVEGGVAVVAVAVCGV